MAKESKTKDQATDETYVSRRMFYEQLKLLWTTQLMFYEQLKKLGQY